MPLPQFKTEKDFREQFIAPFLAKRGLIHVNHTHGSGEQGKDFFFADRDAFENTRFYAVQAKIGDIGSGRKVIDDLINQVRRCFTVRLRFHNKDSHERGCCAVYIMTTGSISPEARKELTDWCRSEKFGDNVYFLDGETLSRLHDVTQHLDDSHAISVLTGLCLELFNNIELCGREQTVKAMGMSGPLLRTHAMISFLSCPILSMTTEIEGVISALKATEVVNAIFGIHPTGSEESKEKTRDAARNQFLNCKNQSAFVLEKLRLAIATIKGRQSISIDVLE